MMKKIFLLLLFSGSSLFAYPRVACDLKEEVNHIYHIPGGKSLLQKVEKEGSIAVYSGPFYFSTSSAMWRSDERSIVLNSHHRRTFGERVRSIIFELHNALSTKEFDSLDWLARSGKISRSQYVEEVERIEHRNALKTCALVNKAISKKLLSPDCRWEIPTNFQAHFQCQIEMGHSEAIARVYDILNPYHYAYITPQPS